MDEEFNPEDYDDPVIPDITDDVLKYFTEDDEEPIMAYTPAVDVDTDEITERVRNFVASLYGEFGVDSMVVAVTATTPEGDATATLFQGIGNGFSQEGAINQWIQKRALGEL